MGQVGAVVVEKTAERRTIVLKGAMALETGAFVLPLICWPNSQHPFSSIKIWLLTGLALFAGLMLLVGKAVRPRNIGEDGRLWLVWPGVLALSAAGGRKDSRHGNHEVSRTLIPRTCRYSPKLTQAKCVADETPM